VASVKDDPRGWVRDQIATPPQMPKALAARPSTEQRASALPTVQAVKDGDAMAKKDLREKLRAFYIDDVAARLSAQVNADAPFHERLVAFWSNHFTVSGTRLQALGFIGAFESEAVRPHVLGRFADLLAATALHPAMLIYLDNARSIGPNSKAGQRRAKGLNENLARELMELHSLGVNGGYTQDDVRALANILTGWTVARPGLAGRLANARDGSAVFVPALHEPGAKMLLGRRYAEDGADEARAAIADLAQHPATARFIARKLARHFVAAPTSALIDALTAAYRADDGHLSALYRVLIDAKELWQAPGKLRDPNDWVVALLRGVGSDGDLPGQRFVAALKSLGQQPFFAPSPAGWPDADESWLSPEGLMARVDFSRASANRAGDIDPMRFLALTVGGDVSDETRFQVRNAASKAEGLALAMLSPEFLWR
jgi:uncharacterized protein (DUF1800 family)